MEQQMKINGDKVRLLREARAWSQEQLATAAGVSARTIQRAETKGIASRETKVCLAAALDIDHHMLSLTPATDNGSDPQLQNPEQVSAVLNVLGRTFFAVGGLMLILLLVSGGGWQSMVFWIGWMFCVLGAPLLFVAYVRRRTIAKLQP